MLTRDGLRAHAHAKINLDLRILATRPDGYHELATVFQTLALHDTLTFRCEPGPFRLHCAMPGIPVDDTNLVVRAADTLSVAAGRGASSGVVVNLEKRIPMQAGLGGGSADAAATLVALNRLWSIEWPVAALTDLAASIGADVAFFLVGGTAEGRGRGDRLASLADVPHHEVVLFMPGFGVQTASAYRWYDDLRAEPSKPGRWPDRPSRWAATWGACRNDLERPVAARHPEIADVLAFVRSRARVAAMSGSGSTVFGLFEDSAAADAVAEEGGCRGWRTLRTATMSREAYLRSLLPSS